MALAEDQGAIEAFVLSHPEGTLYHLPSIPRILERVEGFEGITLVARGDPDGAITGVLPVAMVRSVLFGRHGISLPRFNYGGVLATDEQAGEALALTAWAWAQERGARSVVLRHSPARPLSLPVGHPKESVVLELQAAGPEALWSKIGPKARNLVRKGQRLGLESSIHAVEALDAFHAIYSENMKNLGSPCIGRPFFQALFEDLPAHFRIHLVRSRDRQFVAAAISVRYRGSLESPWAASLPHARAMAAPMVLYWSILEQASIDGETLVDFGRSTPGSGSHRFKLQWKGSQSRRLPWYYLSVGKRDPTADFSNGGRRFRLMAALWKRLPLRAARLLGPIVSRRLPH